MPIRHAPALVLAATLACASAEAVAQADTGVAGTYALWRCSGECAVADTAGGAPRGILVLSDTAWSRDAFPPAVSLRSGFLLMRRTRDGFREGQPNACFAISRSVGMAGIIRHGATFWSVMGDSVEVRLYASPDAFHDLRARVGNGVLRGASREHGYVHGSFDHAAGRILGIRTGPPEITRCFPPESTS